MERTLSLIKPHMIEDLDGNCISVLDTIIDIQRRYLMSKMKIVAIRFFTITEEFLREFYIDHIDKPFFEKDIVPAMNNGQCIAMVLEGEDAIKKTREINGATKPHEASEGTIRHYYGSRFKAANNAVHGSDNPENAEREIKIVFGFI